MPIREIVATGPLRDRRWLRSLAAAALSPMTIIRGAPRIRCTRATTFIGATAKSPPNSARCATAIPAASSGSPAFPARANPPSPPNWSANCSTSASMPTCSMATTSATAFAPISAFSPEDRKENIRRVGEVAKLVCRRRHHLHHRFYFTLSGRPRARAGNRQGAEPDQVSVNAPSDVCEERDTKGLYARARANQISDFTGISAPYEPPLKPDLGFAHRRRHRR